MLDFLQLQLSQFLEKSQAQLARFQQFEDRILQWVQELNMAELQKCDHSDLANTVDLLGVSRSNLQKLDLEKLNFKSAAAKSAAINLLKHASEKSSEILLLVLKGFASLKPEVADYQLENC